MIIDLLLIVRVRDYKCTVGDGDLQFCSQYAKEKPCAVPPEFTELAQLF